ncbi:hypothetical protein SBA_ch1_26630 [Sphingomonas bisphenolicum]|uniref:Uncharacterized protein n=1 Tax=Sphingomonas bisphenolicum TaxID=296544 RepID=A0ABM7G574_9SPHN|nr:hypothetical protein SBA_ch1_26630 [Sphingomonas bisphenolicum]
MRSLLRDSRSPASVDKQKAGRPGDAPPSLHPWPRLHHWLIAAAMLFAMGIAVPLFAAFI